MDGWTGFKAVVAARPDHPAVLMGDIAVSLAGFYDLTLGLAEGLARRGVGSGDRVVVHLANGIEAAALPLAIWALGAVPVLAPLDLGKGVGAIAQRVGAKVVVSSTLAECADAVVVPPDALRTGNGAFRIGHDALRTGSDGAPNGLIGGSDIGSIVFTSGSTGRPKGVVQRTATLLDGVDRVAQAVGFGAQDRLLVAVPFAHDYGWGQLLALYRLGLTLVVAPPGLSGLPEAVERHRPTVLGGVPSVYAGLTRGVSDLSTRERGSVRLVMSTGSVMPQRVWDDLANLFPTARRCLNYGLTETFRSATLRVADEGLAPTVTGSALPGSALCVVDEAGCVLKPGEWGEIVHRGAGVFEGYWDDPDQTTLRRRIDPVTGQGFAVFTGDRGFLDADGRLTLGDRIDRMVKVMGLAASPAAIEAVLRAVPGVDAAAVVSRPHPILGAELVAVLVLAGDESTLKAAQRAAMALAPHERPRVWRMRDALPMTASGKVDLVRLTADLRDDGPIGPVVSGA